MTRKSFLARVALLSGALLGLDFATKVLAEAYLGGRVRLLGGLVLLVFTRNQGAFLSMGASFGPWARLVFLIALPALALAALLAWLILRAPPSRPLAWVAALFLAGGFGNLVERIFVGSVRDFLNFGIGNLRTGVMNLADLYLTAALVVVLLRGRSLEREGEKGGEDEAG
jgi:signal peptidase II